MTNYGEATNSHYGRGSLSKYNSGTYGPSSRAPSTASVPAYCHPRGVRSNPQEPTRRCDANGHSYAGHRDAVYDDGPRIGSSKHHRDSNNRIKYTTHHDAQTGAELARVYEDLEDDPSSWQGGTTARDPVRDIHNGGFSREGGKRPKGHGGSSHGGRYEGSGHGGHGGHGGYGGYGGYGGSRGEGSYSGSNYGSYNGSHASSTASPGSDYHSTLGSDWSEVSPSDSVSNAGRKSGSRR